MAAPLFRRFTCHQIRPTNTPITRMTLTVSWCPVPMERATTTRACGRKTRPAPEGDFHHHIATVDGDWAAAVCDDCYADLHPGITVTVKFCVARVPASCPAAARRSP